MAQRLCLIEHLEELAGVSVQNVDFWRHLESQGSVCGNEGLDVFLIISLQGPHSEAAVDHSPKLLEGEHKGPRHLKLVGVTHEVLLQALLKGLDLLQQFFCMVASKIGTPCKNL